MPINSALKSPLPFPSSPSLSSLAKKCRFPSTPSNLIYSFSPCIRCTAADATRDLRINPMGARVIFGKGWAPGRASIYDVHSTGLAGMARSLSCLFIAKLDGVLSRFLSLSLCTVGGRVGENLARVSFPTRRDSSDGLVNIRLRVGNSRAF